VKLRKWQINVVIALFHIPSIRRFAPTPITAKTILVSNILDSYSEHNNKKTHYKYHKTYNINPFVVNREEHISSTETLKAVT